MTPQVKCPTCGRLFVSLPRSSDSDRNPLVCEACQCPSLPQVAVQLPRDMGARTWGDELLVIHTPHYIGKLLLMKAGQAGGLQKHTQKDEASYLLQGSAWVYTDIGDGKLTRFRLSAGATIHIPPGAVHKVEAIEDCTFFEASTPHFNDRIRLEAEYGREDTQGLPTTR